jgi:hypothetical protein
MVTHPGRRRCFTAPAQQVLKASHSIHKLLCRGPLVRRINHSFGAAKTMLNSSVDFLRRLPRHITPPLVLTHNALVSYAQQFSPLTASLRNCVDRLTHNRKRDSSRPFRLILRHLPLPLVANRTGKQHWAHCLQNVSSTQQTTSRKEGDTQHFRRVSLRGRQKETCGNLAFHPIGLNVIPPKQECFFWPAIRCSQPLQTN